MSAGNFSEGLSRHATESLLRCRAHRTARESEEYLAKRNFWFLDARQDLRFGLADSEFLGRLGGFLAGAAQIEPKVAVTVVALRNCRMAPTETAPTSIASAHGKNSARLSFRQLLALGSHARRLARSARGTGSLSVLKNGRARAIRFSTITAVGDALDRRPGDTLDIVRAGSWAPTAADSSSAIAA